MNKKFKIFLLEFKKILIKRISFLKNLCSFQIKLNTINRELEKKKLPEETISMSVGKISTKTNWFNLNGKNRLFMIPEDGENKTVRQILKLSKKEDCEKNKNYKRGNNKSKFVVYLEDLNKNNQIAGKSECINLMSNGETIDRDLKTGVNINKRGFAKDKEILISSKNSWDEKYENIKGTTNENEAIQESGIKHLDDIPQKIENNCPNLSKTKRNSQYYPNLLHSKILKRSLSDSNLMITSVKEKLYHEQTSSICLDDFTFIEEIGKGAFGKVFKVMRKQSQEILAMKIIRFGKKVTQKIIKEIQNEVSILNVIKGEFLAQAYFSFIERQSLCIVMEYMIGGDFRTLLEKEGRLDQTTARNYIAQLILGVEELHSKDIIHRDIKPENILLDKNLKLKLADFGFSEFQERILVSGKQNKTSIEEESEVYYQRANITKIIGTADYIPPEILTVGIANKQGFSKESNQLKYPSGEFKKTDIINPQNTVRQNDIISTAIDWWAVGCLLYEFLVGVSPFGGLSLDEVYNNILEFKIVWPNVGYDENSITPEAKGLILRFLDLNPVMRLGVKGTGEIKQHKFFEGFDWKNAGLTKSSIFVSFQAKKKNTKFINSFLIPRSPSVLYSVIFEPDVLTLARVDLLHENNLKRLELFKLIN